MVGPWKLSYGTTGGGCWGSCAALLGLRRPGCVLARSLASSRGESRLPAGFHSSVLGWVYCPGVVYTLFACSYPFGCGEWFHIHCSRGCSGIITQNRWQVFDTGFCAAGLRWMDGAAPLSHSHMYHRPTVCPSRPGQCWWATTIWAAAPAPPPWCPTASNALDGSAPS